MGLSFYFRVVFVFVSDGGFEDFCYFSKLLNLLSSHCSLSLSLSLSASLIDEENAKRERYNRKR